MISHTYHGNGIYVPLRMFLHLHMYCLFAIVSINDSCSVHDCIQCITWYLAVYSAYRYIAALRVLSMVHLD